MPLNCPQAVSQLKAYQQQHQKLQTIFDDLLSQVPFLPDVKWDEPFMSSPHYKDITKASKDIFDNLYDAKEEARKKLEEFKKEIGYKAPLTEEDFLKLGEWEKIKYFYYRCFKPNTEPQTDWQKRIDYTEYIPPIPDLKPYEIKFLYYNCKKFHQLFAIIDGRLSKGSANQSRKDLAYAYNCSVEEIASGKNDLRFHPEQHFVYCWGDLDEFNHLRTIDDFNFPDYLNGYMSMDGVKFIENAILPKEVNGHVSLKGLEGVKRLVLPETIYGVCDLRQLKSLEGVTLPKYMEGSLHLDSVTSIKGVKLPDFPNDTTASLHLDSLISVDDLILPSNIGYVYLKSITSLKNLKLPKNFVCSRYIYVTNNVPRSEINDFTAKYPNIDVKVMSW